MKPAFLAISAVATLLCLACGQSTDTQNAVAEQADSTRTVLTGDSTIYGLACDGCNDTILILLTDIGADPDTFNILAASNQHRVFGRPAIGDQMAIVLNADKEADVVIDIERLKASWCYTVTPELKERAGVTADMRDKFMKNMPDSLRQRLLSPIEFGYQLMSENSIRRIGDFTQSGSRDGQESPVVYEQPKRYSEWFIWNGRLLFKETTRDTLGVHTVGMDTAEVVSLRRDTLVLRFSQGERSFYRKSTAAQADAAPEASASDR